MRTFGLACKLELLDGHGESAMATARQVVEGWAAKKESHVQDRVPPRKLERTSCTYEEGPAVVWETKLSQEADNEGKWTTEIRVYAADKSANDLDLAVVMQIEESNSSILAPLRYHVETPAFVRRLADFFSVRIGNSSASKIAQHVSSEAETSELIRQIQQTDRALPLVVVTDPAHNASAIPDLAARIADFLFGLASVCHITSRDATFCLTHALGKMSVFDGGLRLYWPGWSIQDPLSRHPLFLRQRIELSAKRDPDRPDKLVRGGLMAMLASASATRFAYPGKMLSVVKSHQRRILHEELSASNSAQLVEEIKTLRFQLDEFQDLSHTADAILNRTAKEREELRVELEAARKELTRLRAATNAAPEGPTATEESSPWEIVEVSEALERARSDFASTLIIPENVEFHAAPQRESAASA